MRRMGGMNLLMAWLVLALIGAVATVWWGVRMWKRRAELSLQVKALSALVAASAALGALGTLLGLVKVFGATGGESVDPSQTARLLAEGIAEAMNCTMAGLVVWLPSVIALRIVDRRREAKSG